MASFVNIWLGILCTTAVFAICYYATNTSHNEGRGHFAIDGTHVHRIGLFDAIYFSLVTQSTIGYGDMAPTSVFSKSIVFCQCASVLAMFAYLANHSLGI